MQIYHFDPINGHFLGAGDSDKCPVTGADIIPAWATKTPPPQVKENQIARYVEAYFNDPAGHWNVEDVIQPEPELDPEPTPEELQQAALDALDEKYAKIFDALTLAWAIAAMDENDTITAARKTDKEAAKLRYLAEMEAILNG